VEDAEDSRRLFERVFQLAGAEPVSVANGIAAVTAASSADRSGRPFDCILMDIHMPNVGRSGRGARRRRRD
jgi:two-component system sensor histidine kinase/response regulator